MSLLMSNGDAAHRTLHHGGAFVEQPDVIDSRGPAPSNRRPKRYIRTLEGVITRTAANGITVAGPAAGTRRLAVGPRTIVCRSGRAVSNHRALAVGVRVRALFVSAEGTCLTVLIELLGPPAATPSPRGGVTAVALGTDRS